MLEYILVADRIALGLFFATSGYHKLFNAKRHEALVDTLNYNNIPLVQYNQWFVPGVECLGGLALIAGVLSPLAALGLFMICLVATLTDGLKRIPSMQPLDTWDYTCCVLYLPEVLLCLMLAMVIAGGGWSHIDDYIWRRLWNV